MNEADVQRQYDAVLASALTSIASDKEMGASFGAFAQRYQSMPEVYDIEFDREAAFADAYAFVAQQEKEAKAAQELAAVQELAAAQQLAAAQELAAAQQLAASTTAALETRERVETFRAVVKANSREVIMRNRLHRRARAVAEKKRTRRRKEAAREVSNAVDS
ncbi:hypothetical protein AK830_g3940 [Neonectria ditissima]|uniref:Uncharacterized protein n=1 Tax=Neonectria ditissima TaxID=78410 RepID=A0A0P7AX99_9HYPO|nr:hypothetical protein AK830_g3940 [Neonectria ditissima]